MSNVDDDTVSANLSDTSAPPDKKARNKRPLSVSPIEWNESLCYLSGGCCLKCEEELQGRIQSLERGGVHFVEKVEDQKKNREAEWVKEAAISLWS